MSLTLSKQINKGYLLFWHSQPMAWVVFCPTNWRRGTGKCVKSATSDTEITHFEYGKMDLKVFSDHLSKHITHNCILQCHIIFLQMCSRNVWFYSVLPLIDVNIKAKHYMLAVKWYQSPNSRVHLRIKVLSFWRWQISLKLLFPTCTVVSADQWLGSFSTDWMNSIWHTVVNQNISESWKEMLHSA